MAPDIIVEQRQLDDPNAEDNAEDALPAARSEADLRGSLTNDSLTEDEKKMMEDDQKRQEQTDALRQEDYQLSYAIDILRGMSFRQDEIEDK